MQCHRYGGKLPEKTAVDMILAPFLNVLSYLHSNCVVHRQDCRVYIAGKPLQALGLHGVAAACH